jgi:hypothetical protein
LICLVCQPHASQKLHDSAVPPEKLGGYLRGMEALMAGDGRARSELLKTM